MSWAADPASIVQDTWNRYRSVKTEREESEILVIPSPKPAAFSRADIETLVRDGGPGVIHKRAVRHVLYAADWHDKIHILFSLPAEDAGLGFLVWRQPGATQDDMWLYMPGYRAVRRIPMNSKQRLAGTDMLYEDVRELAGERTERFQYEQLADEAIDGRACEVIQATPKPDTTTAYARRKTWIDKTTRFPLKVEFHDASDKLWKVFRNFELREVAPNCQRADVAEMRDVQANQATVMLVTKRAVGLDIPAQVFTEDYLVHPGDD